jgi:hypothetical protein
MEEKKKKWSVFHPVKSFRTSRVVVLPYCPGCRETAPDVAAPTKVSLQRSSSLKQKQQVLAHLPGS